MIFRKNLIKFTKEINYKKQFVYLASSSQSYKYPVLFISTATCDLLKEKENDENFFLYDPFRVNEKENGHKIQSYNTQNKNYQKQRVEMREMNAESEMP